MSEETVVADAPEVVHLEGLKQRLYRAMTMLRALPSWDGKDGDLGQIEWEVAQAAMLAGTLQSVLRGGLPAGPNLRTTLPPPTREQCGYVRRRQDEVVA